MYVIVYMYICLSCSVSQYVLESLANVAMYVSMRVCVSVSVFRRCQTKWLCALAQFINMSLFIHI